MANIILVDPDEIAQKAMRGILARGDYRFVAQDSAEEAWDLIRRCVQVDMVLVELKLKGEMKGLQFIEKLKKDPLLRFLPVVVCTGFADRNSVKQALELGAQNVLLKPYNDRAIFEEVAKALKNRWWIHRFAHPNSPPSGPMYRRPMIEGLKTGLERLLVALESLSGEHDPKPVVAAFEKLSKFALKAGVTDIHECLDAFAVKAADGKWPSSKESLEPLEFAVRLVAEFLKPKDCPEEFLTEEEANAEQEAKDRAFWMNAPAEDRCPMIDRPQLEGLIDKLSGCPVIDSIAAAFRMSANGHPTSLSPLRDLVKEDPALTTQILIAANRLKNSDDSALIEETRMAVGLLGENRLSGLGGSFETIEERSLLSPPHLSWPKFRMFQLGTARMASFLCDYLEFPHLETAAYTAGLIHDIGKLLLIRIYPFAFQAIHEYAVQQGTRLATAERYFLGTSTNEMAAHFAKKQGLPSCFVNVFTWLDKADEATSDAELVAIVSMARDICRYNQVGFNGDTPIDDSIPLEDTPEWRVLRERVYINFDFRKFEIQANRECKTLKREFLDKIAK